MNQEEEASSKLRIAEIRLNLRLKRLRRLR